MKKLLYILCFMPHFGHAMSFQDACSHGKVTQVKKILEEDRGILNSGRDRDGFSPIHYAAAGGSPEVLQLLLDTKPDLINETDERGNIPFSHLFLGIFSWRERIKEEKQLDRLTQFAMGSGILQRIGPSVEVRNAQRVQKFESYKKAIALFISRGAKLDISNNYGKKWIDIPGLDEALAAYACKLIDKKS